MKKGFGEMGDFGDDTCWYVGFEPLDSCSRKPFPHGVIIFGEEEVSVDKCDVDEIRAMVKALKKLLKGLEYGKQ